MEKRETRIYYPSDQWAPLRRTKPLSIFWGWPITNTGASLSLMEFLPIKNSLSSLLFPWNIGPSLPRVYTHIEETLFFTRDTFFYCFSLFLPSLFLSTFCNTEWKRVRFRPFFRKNTLQTDWIMQNHCKWVKNWTKEIESSFWNLVRRTSLKNYFLNKLYPLYGNFCIYYLKVYFAKWFGLLWNVATLWIKYLFHYESRIFWYFMKCNL